MILLKFKEDPEDRGEDMPCSAFRWVLETTVAPSIKGSDSTRIYREFLFGLSHQHQYKSDGSWNSSHTMVYQVGLGGRLSFGSQHVYYDGPHCSFSLGFLHFYWCGGLWSKWCKKCMPEDV